jgi:hypothetical protein
MVYTCLGVSAGSQMLIGLPILLGLGGACIVIAVALLLHHGYIHSSDFPGSHARQESCPEVCYFQTSAVCKFRFCNHENLILLCFCLALLMFAGSVFYI